MNEITRIQKKPVEAEGRISIELIDPLTKKTKEKVEGKNHVFNENLFCLRRSDNHSLNRWTYVVSQLQLYLSDNGDNIDENFPWVKNNIIGYGIPSEAGEGIYKGGYVASNQQLGDIFSDRIKWKFQYEFMTSQANGTIRSLGLTHQFNSSYFVYPYKSFEYFTPYVSASDNTTKDGVYRYSIGNSNGIITKDSAWFQTQQTIDISHIVGTTSNQYKHVAYAPRTKKYYVLVYNSTAANRRLYEFSDNTFSNLLNTYNISNISLGSSSTETSMYVYGDYIYHMYDRNTIRKANFVDNEEFISIVVESFGASYPYVNERTIADEENIYFSYGIFSPDTDSVIVSYTNSVGVDYFHPLVKDFNIPARIATVIPSSSRYIISNIGSAATLYKLATPITKTSDVGMVVTYELDVMFD